MDIQQRIPRLSWVTGVVQQGDAISETVLAELDALQLLAQRERRNLDAKVYCRDTDIADTRLSAVDDWRSVLHDPHFQTSDIYIFHFGVFNEIHDLLNLVRRDATVVVWFHNITPPQYLPAQAEDLVFRSFQQIENFRVADHVLVNSRHTAEVLQPMKLGVPTQVLHLFGRNALESAAAPPAGATPAAVDGERPFRLLFCGRFVESKSVHTLFEALAILSLERDQPIECTLTGIKTYSDAAYLGRLQAMASALPAFMKCSFVLDASNDEVQAAYRKADLFVLPSLHEGFGMPVIEAFSAGTPVVCTPAGALEEVADGLALHFPCGDSAALAAHLGTVIDAWEQGQVACTRGMLAREAWCALAAAHAAEYSRDNYVRRFAAQLSGWLQAAPMLSKSRAESLERLHQTGGVFAPANTAGSSFDAAIHAAVFASNVEAAFRRREEDGLRALLHWPFPGAHQGDSDMAYWRATLQEKGLAGLLRQLADAPEVRGHVERHQFSHFLRDQLAPLVAAHTNGADQSVQAAAALGARLRLLAQAQLSESEFVRQAYRLILRREPEEAGFGGYFNALRTGTLNRHQVLEAFLSSAEAQALHGDAITHTRAAVTA